MSRTHSVVFLQATERIEVKFHVAMHGRTQALVKVFDEPVGSRRIEKLGDETPYLNITLATPPHRIGQRRRSQGFLRSLDPEARYALSHEVRLLSQKLSQ